jgi:hypothetical protein
LPGVPRSARYQTRLAGRKSFNKMLASGIAVLQLDGVFDITQAKWLQSGYRAQALPDIPSVPGAPDLPAVRAIREDTLMRPRDLLLLQVGSSYLRAAPTLYHRRRDPRPNASVETGRP